LGSFFGVPDQVPVQRRLAAILAGDVVGYSRLMGADEVGTLRALKAIRRELADPAIAAHHGRVVKTTGDGILIEFASVVDAVACAVAIQEGMVTRNAGVPEGKRIVFRIGINIGDIIVDEADIHGDGVNVAARLEALALPGDICISGAAHDQVRGRLEVAFEDMGEQSLKNIDRPVRAYRVAKGVVREGGAAQAQPERGPLPLPDKPSIAVLPFQNMSGDPEQEYFADGMVEEIITALSRIRWLFVIARNSSFTYKGRAVDVKQVGRELGVRYILEGSIRKAGGRVRITGQLIDAATGAHLWADRYDRDQEDIFALQDEITGTVASVIEPTLAQAEQRRALRKPPSSLDVWEIYQRGLWHFYKYAEEDNKTAQAFFLRAIDLDPNFAPGHYGFALAQHFNFWAFPTLLSWDEVAGRGREEARLAVMLDDSDWMAHVVLSFTWEIAGEWEASIAEARIAASLNPNSSWSMLAMGHALGWGGYPREGVDFLGQAMRLSPRDPLIWLCKWFSAMFGYFLGDYTGAVDTLREVARLNPKHLHVDRFCAASLAQLGRSEEAKQALQKAFEVSPAFTERVARHRPPWMRPEDYAHLLDGLRKAGLPE
jgi:adenylate cyclase